MAGGDFRRPQMRIYITHCSAKKDDSLANTGRKVTPDQLYTATPTQRFMDRCKRMGVVWAIFSDYYGVWFGGERREWYSNEVGDPNRIDEAKFQSLLKDFHTKLSSFDEICFYYNPGRFHRVYVRLLNETKLKRRIVKITHLDDIV